MSEKVIISKNYYIKPDGKVYRILDDAEINLKPNKNGYICITIEGKSYRLHRLVAEAFIPNPEHKPQIDHINRNKLDNRVENLRWVTAQENSNNRRSNLQKGERKQDLTFTEYKTLEHKKWRDKHRDEYNAKRRLRRSIHK